MTLSALHVAIIMDGNGRWAQERGLPRIAGHRAGALAVRRTVEAARRRGLATLTLYAFSSDNWRRPASEIGALMRLFREYLHKEAHNCARNGIRLAVIGRRDRLPEEVVRQVEAAEAVTQGCRDLEVRIAVDYSSRDAILGAAARRPASREEFSRLLGPDVDLLIRTSGEQRLSDFLLWECAYAEFYFTPRLWPDFGEPDLEEALECFGHRERRFGAVPAVAVG